MPKHILHDFLPNGVEVLIKEDHFTNIAAIQCWVRAGSLHETPKEEGMAHVLEHMLFKGTKTRAVGEIALTVEGCGGNINAYTTFDRTVFYLTLNKMYRGLGVELLADAIYNSSFDAEEYAKEKEVILEEIRRGNDDPGSLIGRKIFEHAYAGSPAERQIIGSEESVKGFSRADLIEFHNKWYQPQNLFVIAVGSFDAKEMYGEFLKWFGQRKSDREVVQPKTNRIFPKDRKVVLLKGDFEEPRIEIAFEAPHLHHPDTAPLDIGSFVLGGGETSRLYQTLREELGTVTSIGASIYAPSFGGILEVSASTTPDMVLESVEGIAKETIKFVERGDVELEELKRAQANMKSDRVYQKETVEGQARSLGFGLFTPYKYHFDDLYFTLIKETTCDDIKEAVRRWISPERVVIAVMVPDSSTITEPQIEQAFAKGVKEAQVEVRQASTKKASSPLKKATAAETQPIVMDISQGFRLVYRYNPSAELFGLTAATRGGLHAETPITNGVFNALAAMMAKATRDKSYIDLQNHIEGFGASVLGFSGKDSFGLRLHCLTEHCEELMGTFAQCFLNPVFPEAQWRSLQTELLEDIRTQDDSPASVCIRKFQEVVYQNHPYRLPIMGTLETVKSFDPKELEKQYLNYRDKGPWVFGAVGSVKPEEMERMIRTSFGSFKPAVQPRQLTSDVGKMKADSEATRIKKDREQAHIVLGYRGLSWSAPERAALDLLTTILGGQGGRLFLQLRDKESLAYSVSPIASYGISPGIVGAYIACSPEKIERATQGLREQLDKIKETAPPEDELQRAKNYIVGNHESDLQRGDSQAMTMALMDIYDIGYDDFLRYPNVIAEVAAKDVKDVASKLFTKSAERLVVVGG